MCPRGLSPGSRPCEDPRTLYRLHSDLALASVTTQSLCRDAAVVEKGGCLLLRGKANSEVSGNCLNSLAGRAA